MWGLHFIFFSPPPSPPKQDGLYCLSLSRSACASVLSAFKIDILYQDANLMVTSNKAGVGSLAPFPPPGLPAPPTPTSQTWWPSTCHRGLWRMCFLRVVLISNLRIADPGSAFGRALWLPRFAGLGASRYLDPLPWWHLPLTPGLGEARAAY